MGENRPSPEELLKRIQSEEVRSNRGKLKIFFGYAAGVGKTYAMLEAAHVAKKGGLDVVVGYVEPHTRPETLALLEGLEILAPLKVSYRNITLKEFDLDEALKRKPNILIVDELAHTNAEGLRHKKRYSDIEELLNAGIDVYTTVNVQHIESLNDIVASITKVIVKERVPDRIFNEAYQVELIDIEPSDLIERLNEGKIYKENQVKRALNHFFVRENLVALREIALRQTADRVNKEVEANYVTNEHILVCISSAPSNAKVIRTAARMAEAFHGKFTALFVETTDSKEFTSKNIETLRRNLKLAEELGARIETVYGDDVPYQVAEFSKVSGISKIIIGRTERKGGFIRASLGIVDKIIELAPHVDVYIIPDKESRLYNPKRKYIKKMELSLIDTSKMIFILCISALISQCFYIWGLGEANIITIYILGILIISNQTRGRFYGAISSLIGTLMFNILFTEPRFALNFNGPGYIITFLVMLLSALITSTLTTKVKSQANVSALIAYRTNVLLDASRELERCVSLEEIMITCQRQVNKLVNKPVIIYLFEESVIKHIYNFSLPDGQVLDSKYIGSDEQAVATWVFKNKKVAGRTTDTLPGARAMYIPLVAKEEGLAVMGIVINEDEGIDSGEKSLLSALLNQISFALEKYLLNESQKKALMQAENERFRANLLRAISHDLRTPLTSISGSANSMLINNFSEDIRKKLLLDIYDDSMWLINLVENLLSVSRIDNENVSLRIEPQMVEDIINEALQHISRKSVDHIIKVNINNDLLMVNVDVRLIVQVIINVVDNAIKYTDDGSKIYIKVYAKGKNAVFEICDNGNGITEHDKQCIFDMFFTVDGNKGDSRRGLGLGLALCKSIVNAHGGEIYVKDNKPKGTIIGFTLGLVEVEKSENINFSS